MTPEYINELADMVDPSLWRLSPFDQMKLPPGMRKALDAGVALRRHAAHVARLRDLLNEGKSLLITPLSLNGSALRAVETPPDHRGMPTRAASDVLAERRRQIEAEGWTPEHDDEHTRGELVQAAADLCLDGTDFRVADPDGDRMIGWGLTERHRDDRRRQLVIAGALILAEIERLDRMTEVSDASLR